MTNQKASWLAWHLRGCRCQPATGPALEEQAAHKAADELLERESEAKKTYEDQA